jgi:hypothetical protein
LSSEGPYRSRRDTGGHGTDTVRDREAPGSNPGPPTNFEFKSPISHAVGRASEDGRSQPCHRFSWNSAVQVDCGPSIELAHGNRTADISARARPQDREVPGSNSKVRRHHLLRGELSGGIATIVPMCRAQQPACRARPALGEGCPAADGLDVVVARVPTVLRGWPPPPGPPSLRTSPWYPAGDRSSVVGYAWCTRWKTSLRLTR